MAGVTNSPYRRLMKQHGAALLYSEMVSAAGLVRDSSSKTAALLDHAPEEAPFIAQLFGADPGEIAQAARYLTQRGDIQAIDVNLSCPVPKVVRQGAGSALLSQPQQVACIISALRQATPLPLSIKIRSGWDQQQRTYLTISRIAQEEGIDAVTLHPRTRSQFYSGHSRWQEIAELSAKLEVPVWGSGDVWTAEDAVAMLAQTGCKGVLIARGSYGNPWIFQQAMQLWQNQALFQPNCRHYLETALAHMRLFVDYFGEDLGCRQLRKHLSWYAKGFTGASHWRQKIQQCTTESQMRQLCYAFWDEACTETDAAMSTPLKKDES